RGAEERRPVDVRPEDDDRQRPEDAPRGPAAVGREQPDERDEEREDEALDAERPRAPRDDDERGEREPGDAPGRAAVAAGGDDREGDGAGERGHVDGERGPDAADDVRAVEEELAEPLLVGPRAPVRPD